MPLVVECPDCGARQSFADAKEGVETRCEQCGAAIGVGKKSATFVSSKKRVKKKRRAEPKPAARLTDSVRKEAILAGESGVKIMLAALVANLAAFFLIAFAFFNSMSVGHAPVVVPYYIAPALGLISSALLMAAMFRWRSTAAAIERGMVVQVGVFLGPILFAIELGRMLGLNIELLSWVATYGRMVYFTLLVVYLERVCVLADRSDLQDLANRVLSCGVGVIGVAMIQQFVAIIPFFPLAVAVALLSAVMTVLWVVWCVEYFRLLLYAVSLQR